MKKAIPIAVLCLLFFASESGAARDAALLAEIQRGARPNIIQHPLPPLAAPAPYVFEYELEYELEHEYEYELEYESAETEHKADKTQGETTAPKTKIHIPTNMYIRMGGGWTAEFISGHAKYSDGRANIEGGYAIALGLGWNLSPITRAEIAYNQNQFDFAGTDKGAITHQLVGMLYFDLVNKYVARASAIKLRPFVPFFGLGVGTGWLAFDDMADPIEPGQSGMFWAPRAEIGVNIAIRNSFGIDLAYRYEMYITDKFGWQGGESKNPFISNFMASVRFNF